MNHSIQFSIAVENVKGVDYEGKDRNFIHILEDCGMDVIKLNDTNQKSKGKQRDLFGRFGLEQMYRVGSIKESISIIGKGMWKKDVNDGKSLIIPTIFFFLIKFVYPSLPLAFLVMEANMTNSVSIYLFHVCVFTTC